jgi:hypothetical protein
MLFVTWLSVRAGDFDGVLGEFFKYLILNTFNQFFDSASGSISTALWALPLGLLVDLK